MLISVLISRAPDMSAHTSLSWWSVAEGSHLVHRARWRPEGPMTVVEATMQGLRALASGLLVPDRGLIPQGVGTALGDRPAGLHAHAEDAGVVWSEAGLSPPLRVHPRVHAEGRDLGRRAESA